MKCDHPCAGPDFDPKSSWIAHLTEMSSGVDIRGIEIAGMIRMLTRFFDIAVRQSSEFGEPSGPRLDLLLRLMAEEDKGNASGINPTHLSHLRQVKKNTISALISGLEEQGLVERSVDPDDKRGCLIRVTPAGRELVKATAPQRFQFMNHAVSSLSSEEQDQMLVLLGKLQTSLIQQIHIPHEDNL